MVRQVRDDCLVCLESVGGFFWCVVEWEEKESRNEMSFLGMRENYVYGYAVFGEASYDFVSRDKLQDGSGVVRADPDGESDSARDVRDAEFKVFVSVHVIVEEVSDRVDGDAG